MAVGLLGGNDNARTCTMMNLIDKTPLIHLLLITVMLGLAPFFPEPHLWEKLKMLSAGTLVKPLDIFDLLMHASPIPFLLIKLYRMNMM